MIDGFKNSGRKIAWYCRNLEKPAKVAILVPKVAEATEYLHNPDALITTMVGMSLNYDCSGNNINIMKPLSSIGSKSKRSAAAPRYSLVRKEAYFDNIFMKDDQAILEQQEFEGKVIEPKFLVPTLPMALINANSGMGFGFANYTLSRNPKDIIKILKDTLTHNKLNVTEIVPFVRGFKGTITKISEEFNKKKWQVNGVYEKVNAYEIRVTELPFWYDRESYMIKLESLKEKKVIASFKDYTVGNNYNFEIKVPAKFWEEYASKDMYKVLLLSTDETENFTFVTKDNTVKQYNNELDILNDYIAVKLEYTQKRKDYQLLRIREEVQLNIWKRNFIELVVTDKVIINKKSKAEILTQLKEQELPTGKNDEDRNKHLSMPIYNLTSEKITELNKYIDNKKAEYKALEAKTINDIWLEDINALEKML
jgi:DNA topoisomerase-2